MKKFIMMANTIILSLALMPVRVEDPSIGGAAPGFTLNDTSGQTRSLADYKGRYVVLEWINHGCPFVQKHYDTNNMQTLQKEMTAKGVTWLSICSSAEGKEGHMTAQEWNKVNKEKGSAATAVLLDGDGKVGKLYGAKTTPHMFVIDPNGKLVYKGAIDDKPTTNKDDVKSARNYVREALNASMAGTPISTASTQAYGCSVKYKK